jgi:hypothetical protein
MPLLDDAQVQDLLARARTIAFALDCCAGGMVLDYCRTCDQFYGLHSPSCGMYEDKHEGHRLTIVPFVEERLQPYIVCPRCGMASHNRHDIRERYCANCHAFHDDIIQR